MAVIDNNTIQLGVSATSPYLERKCGVITDPGMLLMLNSSNVFIPCTLADVDASTIFAVENYYTGKGIDDQYAIGDRVFARHCRAGDRILAFLQDAATTSIGTFLTSAGDGTLKPSTVVGSVICTALEALTAVGVTRIVVEVH